MVLHRILVLLCVLVVAGALAPAAVASSVDGAPGVASHAGEGPRAAPSIVLAGVQAAPETDNTVTRIVLQRNGTAVWTLQIRTRLESDAGVEEYRAFQERFRENASTNRGSFAESIAGIVGNARDVTGREMEASGFRAETSIQTVPRRWGIVTYEFRWSGFAATDGGRLAVGDVFEGGLFIAEGDSLEIVAPAGYRIDSADPTPDEVGDGVATWRGREDFADRRPRVVVAPRTSAGDSGAAPTFLGSAAVVALVVLSVVGLWRWRRGNDGSVLDSTPGDDGGDAATRSPEVGGESPPADGELLADEDYVRRLLSDHGGRMRQKTVAEELDWSTSKTSRVLGRMEEAGSIRKLQLGRENVIALPNDDS